MTLPPDPCGSGTAPGGRPLRIVLHLDVLQCGGLEKKVMHLALGLDRSRFEPMVTWSAVWGSIGDRLSEAGIPTPRLKINERTLLTATAQLHDLQADIFHSFSCHKNDLDVRAATNAGVPRIVTNRGNVRHWDEEGRLRSWEADRNRATHAITACSNAVGWVCRNVERVPWSKIAVLYNGVAIPQHCDRSQSIREELGIAAGATLLGYVANYRAVKNHDVLLHAFRRVRRARPDACLVCCGGDVFQEGRGLPALVSKLGLERSVNLLGARQDIDAVYRGLDLYVHASQSEGLSNAILEAMAHGLPVVATSAGGIGEAVEEGVTALLVPPGDERALAEAILSLLSNDERRRRFGREGRARAMRLFTLPAMIDAYSRFYEGLAGRAGEAG